MSSSSSYDSRGSIATTDDERFVTVKPSLESLAVAITFGQTIRQFSQDAPSKLKWCDLTNTDMKRLNYYNIIEPASMDMGETTRWSLKDWVTILLDRFDVTFNFSAKQIKQITDNSDFLLSYDDSFTGSSAPVGNRKLGQLRTLNLLEFDDDNRNNHDTTTWQRTEKVERLIHIHEQL